MSSQIKQMLVMIRANLGSLPRRLWISASMALSVALAVAILIGFLAMAAGFENTLAGTGSTAVAVVLGGGTNQEIDSDVPADAIRLLQADTGDIGVARDAAGRLALSRELVVPVEAKRKSDGTERTLALRGMDPAGPALRDHAVLAEGRLFAPGSHEIVVGDRIAREFSGFAVGDTVRLGTIDWTVVGRFVSGGSAFESEIWGDLDAVQSGFDRQGLVQSLRVRLTGPDGLQALRHALAVFPGAPLVAVSEADLYAAQSARIANLIRLFGWPIALLMAIGATAGALNTMMSSVSDRTVEIATLRTLGFNRVSAFSATWIEAIALAMIGVAIGGVAASVVFDGWQASTVGANDSQMAFQLMVTGDVILKAGLVGLATGIVGGALPAIAASRLPLATALRAKI